MERRKRGVQEIIAAKMLEVETLWRTIDNGLTTFQ
jgi:hypothetical protein